MKKRDINRYGLIRPLQVNHLDIKTLKVGMHHQFIQLSERANSKATSVPIMVAKGNLAGPTLCIVSAIHGNELNGISVIHDLFADIDCDKLRGSIIGIVMANVPATLQHKRCFPNEDDLNHIFPGKPDGTFSESYAFNLLNKIILKADYVIDLHTASAGRINSLYVRADMKDPIMARMARLINPQIILDNIPPPFTLRGQMIKQNIPAITIEIGNPSVMQPDLIKVTMDGIKAILNDLGMASLPHDLSQFKLVQCSSSEWLYTKDGGILEVLPKLTQVVKKGQKIAILKNVFGEIVEEYYSRANGIVLGKSIDPIAERGARIIHIGYM